MVYSTALPPMQWAGECEMSWIFSDAQTEALASVVLLWTASLDGAVVEPNPSWERFTGQRETEYLGWGWLAAVHPDDREAARETWTRALASEQRLVMSYRLRRTDGEYRHMAVVGTLVGPSAQRTGWIGSCQDMTEARHQELATRQNEERLRFLDALGQAVRTLVDASEIMALTARFVGEHLGVHRCAYADVEANGDTFTIRADWSRPGVPSSAGVYSLSLFGSQAVHDMHKGVFLVVNDVDHELGDENGGRMFNAIGIKAIVCAPLVKAGRLVAMMAVHHATPRPWTERELSLLGEVVDRCWAHIERVRAAALVLVHDRRKDEFLATLAHELRNPLAPMRYATAIMERVPAGSAQFTQAQQIINRQVGMMARLVDDLLDLSRVNRGLIELRREMVDLREVVDQAVETTHSLVLAAEHRLQRSVPTTALLVDGDRARLVQVVSNLLNNAVKYTPQGGHIRIAAWASGDRAVIEVTDNGIGIPPQEQGKLFQMFTQLPHTAQRSQGGLGIGLSLVKTLVDLHQGVVRVESAGLDQGSAFTVELPIVHTGSRPDPTAVDAAGRLAKQKVLVVEDNPDGRESLVELLRVMGNVVESAPDGVAGLEMAMRFRPQVALLDLSLPRMDGLTLARELRRRRPLFADLKLIALTGWGTEKDRALTAAAGFDEHLTKPVNVEDLEALLPRLFAGGSS